MNANGIRSALGALRTAAPAPTGGILPIASSHEGNGARLSFGINDASEVCALFSAGRPATGFPTFRSEALTCEFRGAARVAIHGAEEVHSALVLRCTDITLYFDVYAALIQAIWSTFETRSRSEAWTEVAALATRWAAFFRKPDSLSEPEEMGLWGELWTINASANRTAMLDAWRGSEGATYDFFRSGCALEVKASTRRGVHYVSHEQVAGSEGVGVLLSLEVLVDPKGTRLRDLESRITEAVDNVGPYYEALRRRGINPLTIARSERRWSLVGVPMTFPLKEVPRIGALPNGISEVRYKVTLDERRAVKAPMDVEILSPFEMNFATPR